MDGSSGSLAEPDLLKHESGNSHSCVGKGSYDITLTAESNGLLLGGKMESVQEGDHCVAQVKWDPTSPVVNCTAGQTCQWATHYELEDIRIRRNFDSDEIEVTHGVMAPQTTDVPELVNRTYSNENQPSNPIPYNRTTTEFICGAQPADTDMYCTQSIEGDWTGYRWYKFVEQPAFQRLSLTEAEKDWIQDRIVRLHNSMAATSPLNQWLKPPPNLPPLVSIDESSIVTPPPGMEVGYVPIVVYQGMNKIASCDVYGSSAPTTQSPTNNPTDVPSTVPSNSPSVSSMPSISEQPSDAPSTQPSLMPSDTPTRLPSQSPSISQMPSTNPTSLPSKFPSNTPSTQPSTLPSSTPSSYPSAEPSTMPSNAPTCFDTPPFLRPFYCRGLTGVRCRRRRVQELCPETCGMC